MINLKSILPIATLLVGASAFSQSTTFKIGTGSPAQQIAQVESATELETFTGRTAKVTGTLTVNAKTKSASGKISVDVKSIETGIPTRDEHMQSAGWLDAAKYPEITFEAVSAKQIKGDDYAVTGKFTLHGVTKPLTVTANVKLRKASDLTKKAGFKGDVLLIKSTFKVALATYGVQIPAIATGKVAPTVSISITAYAQSGS